MNTNQLITNFKKPIWVLVFLFPIVAASVKDAGSTLYIFLFLVALIFGWPGWKLLEKQEKHVLLGMVAFFSVIVLALLNTDDFTAVGREFERYMRLLAIVPIYLLMRRIKLETGRALFYGAAIGCIVLAIQAGYYVYIAGHTNSVSGAYHKIIFGDSAVLWFTVVITGSICLNVKRWEIALGLLCAVAAVYASIMSQTRQSWFVIPLMMLVWLWFFRSALSQRGWFLVGLTGVLVLIGGIFWQPTVLFQGIQQGITDLEQYEVNQTTNSSWGSRLNMWHDSWVLFKQSPLLGVGVGDFKLERKRLIENKQAPPGTAYGHAHSIYVNTLATMGILGIISLLICLFYLPLITFYRLRKSANSPLDLYYAIGGFTSILCFAAFGFSETWLSRNPFINEYAMVLLVFMSSAFISRSKSKLQSSSESLESSE